MQPTHAPLRRVSTTLLTTLTVFASHALAQAPDPQGAKSPREPDIGNSVKAPAVYPAVYPAKAALTPAATPTLAPSRDLLPENAKSAAPSFAMRAAENPVAPLSIDEPSAGEIWARGEHYKIGFDQDGWRYVAQPRAGRDGDSAARALEPIHFKLHSAQVANQALPLDHAASPQRSENVVSYEHPSVVERIILAPKTAEQTFTFDALPARGELIIKLDVSTELKATLDPTGGLTFASADTLVSYSAAVAFDAQGHRVDAPLAWDGEQITLRVPAHFVQQAELPLVVDPIVARRTVTSDTARVTSPDVVWDDVSQQWQVVYQREFGPGDWDVFVQRMDAALNLVGAPIVVDISLDSWVGPKIANLRASATSLVVAECRRSSNFTRIAGRTLSTTGTLGLRFDIANTSSTHSIRPDVGGDAASGPTYFTVVWEHVFGTFDHDIHARQVTTTGTLRGTGPTIIQSNTENQTNPAISKSCGAPPFNLQRFVIVYQETFSPTDEDIFGAMLTWDGVFVPVNGNNTFAIDRSSFFNEAPEVSSPGFVDGTDHRRIMAVYSEPNTNGGDAIGTTFDETGAVLNRFNVQLAVGDATRLPWEQSRPSVDSSGTRFAVSYTEAYRNTTDLDSRIAMFSVSRTGQATATDSANLASTTVPERDVKIASHYSSSYAVSELFCTSNSREGTRFEIDAQVYGDPTRGAFSVRGTGCGGLLQIQSSGPATPGLQLNFTTNAGNTFCGFVVGFPTNIPIPGCSSCILGVQGSAVSGQQFDQYTLTIPSDVGVIGLQLAVQGFMFNFANPQGTTCRRQLHLSDTIDVTIQ